ncbi:hypothetical protein PPTS312_09840 [Pseudomonas putida]|uniref:Uncharacterized protein n=1 Tax=Pseudomonas putida TaxID=303 RepID=A0A7U6RAX8_PSEPU|nr:hypothetical protein PPTS312_09840 [Pseudomonas putida]
MRGKAFTGTAQQHFGGQFGGAELTVAGRVTQVVEQLAQGSQHCIAAVTVDQREAGRVAQKGVDGWEAWGVAG